MVSLFVLDSGKPELILALLNCSLMCLVSENQRPSLRYLGEWMLTLFANSCPDLAVPQIEAAFEKAKSSRLSSIPGFLSVFAQLALASGKSETLASAMTKVIPWTMAQHFGTRLTAQVLLAQMG